MHRCENIPAGIREEGSVEGVGHPGNINSDYQRQGLEDPDDPLMDFTPLAS